MRENRDLAVALARSDFTARYVDYWRQTTGGLPVSHGVSDIASPCVAGGDGDAVYWQPCAAAQAYYCSQYAGDIAGRF